MLETKLLEIDLHQKKKLEINLLWKKSFKIRKRIENAYQKNCTNIKLLIKHISILSKEISKRYSNYVRRKINIDIF